QPAFLKYLALPFVVAAAPFKYAADKLAGDPAPAPAVPRNGDQPRPVYTGQPAPDYETTQLQDMERELAQRGATPGAAPAYTPPAPSATPAYSAPAPSAGSGFADELAALRARAGSPSAPQAAASAPRLTASPAPTLSPAPSAPPVPVAI